MRLLYFENFYEVFRGVSLFHVSEFFLFFKYFGVLFLISFLPTMILFLIVKSLLREHRYFLRIGFVSFICVDSLVLEGLEMFAASFD